jgi:dihydrofolate reductase
VTAQAGTRLAPEIVFMVAVAQNNVIGRDNAMPWHLKSDLQRFKKLTLNKPVIMGRKTFASIGRPLPGRTNIVVTRDPNFRAAGAVIASSLPAAYDVALGDALRRCAAEIVVIGGADIFAQWMARADRIEITQVHAAPEGDVFFAPVDMKEWQEVARQSGTKGDGDSADFSYVTYKRYNQSPHVS